jgi:SulP family sulfate permease
VNNNNRFTSFTKIFFPFLTWLTELRSVSVLRADIIAGITVALVLIPQSMAYAQLAGLPPYYGLYAAFLPPMVAAIFGSSRQLATGPVAVVSLLSAAALEPLATAGGESFIAYSIMLALLVGLFQLSLGLLRLGVLINFLSHPVVLGFTNAAAIIIATSQLSKIFGVSVEKASQHYETVWNTVVAASTDTHGQTLAFAVLAFVIMVTLKRISPRIPNVLIAVVVTVVLSWYIGFERTEIVKSEYILNPATRAMVARQHSLMDDLAKIDKEAKIVGAEVNKLTREKGRYDDATVAATTRYHGLRLEFEKRQQVGKDDQKNMRTMRLRRVERGDNKPAVFYLEQYVPADVTVGEYVWDLTGVTEDGDVILHAGGRVVGEIPQGLPAFKAPRIDIHVLFQLFVSAIAIGLIGFMEAISIAKAMAAQTRQHLDANQELVGQGLSNMVGSFFQSYAVSGSFSRSAVSISAGAITGFSSVVTSIVVAIALLWLTPLLYHLPQATLAAVIMVAVIGLVNFKAFINIWRIERGDGIIALLTFVLTLAFAPHLEIAIIVGVILSLGIYLSRTMQPRVAELSRHNDGSLRDADAYGLQTCQNTSVIRFFGSLYFANINYFEDKIMHTMSVKPELRFVIVDAVSINNIDASGVEMLESVTERLDSADVQVLFSRVKLQVMRKLEHSGFVKRVGEERFFRNNELALESIYEVLGNDHAVDCPLNIVCLMEEKPA